MIHDTQYAIAIVVVVIVIVIVIIIIINLDRKSYWCQCYCYLAIYDSYTCITVVYIAIVLLLCCSTYPRDVSYRSSNYTNCVIIIFYLYGIQ
jgi:hypothetical protein